MSKWRSGHTPTFSHSRFLLCGNPGKRPALPQLGGRKIVPLPSRCTLNPGAVAPCKAKSTSSRTRALCQARPGDGDGGAGSTPRTGRRAREQWACCALRRRGSTGRCTTALRVSRPMAEIFRDWTATTTAHGRFCVRWCTHGARAPTRPTPGPAASKRACAGSNLNRAR